ncbi:MAG TPA: hypothetical protein P5555_17625 [Candidatus Paceibacterota bacterium]|nr:hypothetical protein [Verrucomicrobiota bacterium]HRZ47000.1 hypothetical protein [Candidatus Paceibacterota bacterium]
MKPKSSGNLWNNLLLVLALISALLTVLLSYQYVQSMRNFQRSQPVRAAIGVRQALINSMAAEAMEYSRRNPAIVPILQAFNLMTNAPATNRASGASPKPATR